MVVNDREVKLEENEKYTIVRSVPSANQSLLLCMWSSKVSRAQENLKIFFLQHCLGERQV